MIAKRQLDQREFPRALVAGSAIVLTAGRYVGTYLVENLSATGALLVGDTSLSVGSRGRLLLQLHHQRQSFAIEASVVRHSKAGAQAVFAVRFVDVSAPVRDALQADVLHHVDRRRHELVLIIEAAWDDAITLERDIRDLGRETAVVRTALDAIGWLQAPGASVRAVIANGALVSMDGLSLLEFIAVDYPHVRRILACSTDFARVHQEAATPGRVDAYLEAPWTLRSLLRALEASP